MPKSTAKATPKKIEAKKEVVAPVTPVAKTVKHLNKNIKISPRKLRLLAEVVKKMKPAAALVELKFTNSKAARVLVKAVQNVISDAKNNYGLNPETLKFGEIRVDEGMKIKRMDKAHGSRFARGMIMKRHSRLSIVVNGEASN